jgi:hypothetical protein
MTRKTRRIQKEGVPNVSHHGQDHCVTVWTREYYRGVTMTQVYLEYRGAVQPCHTLWGQVYQLSCISSSQSYFQSRKHLINRPGAIICEQHMKLTFCPCQHWCSRSQCIHPLSCPNVSGDRLRVSQGGGQRGYLWHCWRHRGEKTSDSSTIIPLFDRCSSRSTLFNSVHTGWSWPLFLYCIIERGHVGWFTWLPLL